MINNGNATYERLPQKAEGQRKQLLRVETQAGWVEVVCFLALKFLAIISSDLKLSTFPPFALAKNNS